MKNRRIMLTVGLAVVIVFALVLLISSTRPETSITPGTVQDIAPAAYQEQFGADRSSHLLVDVRTPEEFATGHIAGAVNIPVDDLAGRLAEVPSDRPIVVYCGSGNRSARASVILAEAGYTPIYDLGGLNAWTEAGYSIQ